MSKSAKLREKHAGEKREEVKNTHDLRSIKIKQEPVGNLPALDCLFENKSKSDESNSNVRIKIEEEDSVSECNNTESDSSVILEVDKGTKYQYPLLKIVKKSKTVHEVDENDVTVKGDHVKDQKVKNNQAQSVCSNDTHNTDSSNNLKRCSIVLNDIVHTHPDIHTKHLKIEEPPSPQSSCSTICDDPEMVLDMLKVENFDAGYGDQESIVPDNRNAFSTDVSQDARYINNADGKGGTLTTVDSEFQNQEDYLNQSSNLNSEPYPGESANASYATLMPVQPLPPLPTQLLPAPQTKYHTVRELTTAQNLTDLCMDRNSFQYLGDKNESSDDPVMPVAIHTIPPAAVFPLGEERICYPENGQLSPSQIKSEPLDTDGVEPMLYTLPQAMNYPRSDVMITNTELNSYLQIATSIQQDITDNPLSNSMETAIVKPASNSRRRKSSCNHPTLGDELDTKDIAERVTNDLKKYCIAQSVFAKRILSRTQGTLSDLLRNPKPWQKLASGRETFRRMWNWLQHPEDIRIAILRQPAVAGENDDPSEDNKSDVNFVDDELGLPTPGYRRQKSPARHVFSDVQRRTLHAIFKEITHPSKTIQKTIAEQLGLEIVTVSNFFMNARRRSVEKWIYTGDNDAQSAAPKKCVNTTFSTKPPTVLYSTSTTDVAPSIIPDPMVMYPETYSPDSTETAPTMIKSPESVPTSANTIPEQISMPYEPYMVGQPRIVPMPFSMVPNTIPTPIPQSTIDASQLSMTPDHSIVNLQYLTNNQIATEIAGTQIAGTQIGGTQIGGTQITGTHVTATQIAGTHIAGTQIAGTQTAGTQIAPVTPVSTITTPPMSGFRRIAPRPTPSNAAPVARKSISDILSALSPTLQASTPSTQTTTPSTPLAQSTTPSPSTPAPKTDMYSSQIVLPLAGTYQIPVTTAVVRTDNAVTTSNVVCNDDAVSIGNAVSTVHTATTDNTVTTNNAVGNDNALSTDNAVTTSNAVIISSDAVSTDNSVSTGSTVSTDKTSNAVSIDNTVNGSNAVSTDDTVNTSNTVSISNTVTTDNTVTTSNAVSTDNDTTTSNGLSTDNVTAINAEANDVVSSTDSPIQTSRENS